MSVIVKGKNPRKPHTVRYWVDGKQREKSFVTAREARDFKIKTDHDVRAQIFVDPKQSAGKFADAAADYLSSRSPATQRKYNALLNNHILPVIGHMSISAVADGRDQVENLLTVKMPASGQGVSQVRTSYVIIKAVINAAVRTGKLQRHNLNGISVDPAPSKTDFVFPTHDQLVTLAGQIDEGYRLTVWLMRGCGLRIGEAMAVSKRSLFNGSLRLSEQMLEDGSYGPLKGRKPGEYRDVPVPSYVAQMLADARTVDDQGHLFAPMVRSTFTRWFKAGRLAAGLGEGFTPHSLRHVFASVALSNGVPITDVSKWLGHRDINITYGTYGHLVPSSFDRARSVLDAEYSEWSEVD